MVMTRALDHNPHMAQADEYRSIVDEAFALSAPAGGLSGVEGRDQLHGPLVDGGREAWDLLFRLRAQAWQKCGADPDILWTRQQVRERSYARAERLTREIREPWESEAHLHPAHAMNEGNPTDVGSEIFDESLTPGRAPLSDLDWAQWHNLFGNEGGDLGDLFANDY